MINTWYVENEYTHTIYGYHRTAGDAKEHLRELAKSRPIEQNGRRIRMVKLRGHYWGEGYHEYYGYYNDIKDRMEYIRR